MHVPRLFIELVFYFLFETDQSLQVSDEFQRYKKSNDCKCILMVNENTDAREKTLSLPALYGESRSHAARSCRLSALPDVRCEGVRPRSSSSSWTCLPPSRTEDIANEIEQNKRMQNLGRHSISRSFD